MGNNANTAEKISPLVKSVDTNFDNQLIVIHRAKQ